MFIEVTAIGRIPETNEVTQTRVTVKASSVECIEESSPDTEEARGFDYGCMIITRSLGPSGQGWCVEESYATVKTLLNRSAE